MPTRQDKGGGPDNRTTGRAARGGQKAVTGSGRSPEVIDEARESRRRDAPGEEQEEQR